MNEDAVAPQSNTAVAEQPLPAIPQTRLEFEYYFDLRLVDELTDRDFTEEINNRPGVSVVHFFGPGCAPCKQQAQTMNALSLVHNPTIRQDPEILFACVNTDNEQQVSTIYDIESVPTVIIFLNGKPKSKFQGLASEADVSKAIDDAVEEYSKADKQPTTNATA